MKFPPYTMPAEEMTREELLAANYRLHMMETVNGQIIRDILVAMCENQGVSTESPWEEHDGTKKEAPNFVLAQRLGIGRIFGIPNDESED